MQPEENRSYMDIAADYKEPLQGLNRILDMIPGLYQKVEEAVRDRDTELASTLLGALKKNHILLIQEYLNSIHRQRDAFIVEPDRRKEQKGTMH